MATIGRNISFPIYNGDGTSFHDLVMKRATYDSIVMSLGDKITGDVYYKDNTLVTNQDIYIVYNGVHYTLVNPPTIVREGMASENGELKGMTKYSFEFYHPMYQLNNFPFSDIAVTSSQGKYLSQNKTFAWIGDLYDYVDKINVNLEGTVWCCEIGSSVQEVDKAKLSDVLSFNNQTIADALKTGYETWEIPYVISQLPSTDTRYSRDGKRFLITFGLPSTEIIGANNQPYVFRFGQGVGLKNNSRTPRNNKIVTRLAGYGSENNIPWGYPQIIWTGDASWNYTIGNDPTEPNSYPIYDGIVNGERVRLIKHPFTRNHLMPSIYAETVNRKVNPNARGYDPDTVIIDYYDADDEEEFENIINSDAPSYEIHEFEDIKPELGEQYLVDVSAYDANAITLSECKSMVLDYYSESNIEAEKTQLLALYNALPNTASSSGSSGVYKYDWSIANDGDYLLVKYKSSGVNFEHKVTRQVTPDWDDSIDDDGNYKQSYFKVTLPELGFDLYACAALTEKMQINMRSGDCIGCTFDVMIDWDDYKKNFYTEDGKFDPVIGTGHPRNGTKYPDSTNDEITLIVQKDNNTFGIIMPNIYQQPTSRDKFVILGISLPLAYITDAEERLDADMIQYMKDNNVFYFDYPLKFDENFLYRNTYILAQMKPNVIVRFEYAGIVNALYIKQMSIKYGQGVLPQYDITLTDDVEIVLNKIGQVTDEVSKLRLMMGEGGDANVAELDKRYLSKRNDDTAEGMISMTKGLYVGNNFVTGLLGEGGVMRVDNDGTTYLEVDKMYVRMRAYFDTVEVRRFLHSGGNRIASLAGMKCTRVEYINSSGNVTKDASSAVKFRCYFRANDDGNAVTNDFVVGDLAFCKETNADTQSINQHGYWRAVVGKSSTPNSKGEHWIDLSASDCLSGSDIPIAQDDIIQLGNKTDTTRQGAIIEYVGGADAPAYQIYQGINTYSLNNKNYVRFGYDSQSGSAQAYIGNPDGSTYLWYHNVTEGGVPIQRLDIKANVKFTSPTTQEETNIQDFAQSVVNEMADLQSQIDGEIDTWFYAGTPTLNNLPASEWNSDDEKDRHLGDLYYDIGTEQTAGFAYRFIKNLNDVYEWQYLEDTAITEALAAAARAQDTADHKRRVFLSQPTPPYDAGDLWAEGENGDLFRCTNSRQSGNYVASDWELATKYTDDSALEAFKVDVSNDYGYLTRALNNETEITGGLLLTSLIGLRDGNQNIQSGINAILKQSLGTKSIAAWFGGAMSDKENPTYYTDNRYAKSLFRFDGTGYLAGGNITWNADGSGSVASGNLAWNAQGQITKIAGQTITATSVTINGSAALTQSAADVRYVRIDFFNQLFAAFSVANPTSSTQPINPATWTSQTIVNNIKAKVGLWTEQYLSVLGLNSQGGGGTGIEMPQVWEALAQAGNNEPINYTHIQSALNSNGYMHSFSKTSPAGANVVTDVNYNSSTGTLSVTRGSLAMNALAPRDIPSTLATFFDGDNLIYTRAGGSNSVEDKPSGVTAFGVITMRTAGGYYGQILYGANGHIYYRSAEAANLGGTDWNTLLGTLNYKSYTYDKTQTYNKNMVLASSASADGNAATFRALVAADIPSLPADKIGSGTFDKARIPDLSSLYVPISTKWWGQSISNGAVSGSMTGVGSITPVTTSNPNIGTRDNYFGDVYGVSLTLADINSNEDMYFGWRDVTINDVSERVFTMYAYQTRYSDILLGQSGASPGGGIFYDVSKNRVGIGTYTPQRTLDIAGTLGVSGMLYANGKITVTHEGGTGTGNELIVLSVGENATYNCISYVKSSGWTNGYNWSSGINADGYYLWNAANGGTQKLVVTNDGQTQVKSLKIGTITLTDDNGLLKIDKGVYSLGTVSALGANNDSSGGGGADIADVWAALATPDSSKLIDSSHINITTSGEGNAFTGITKSGTSITLNKGISFLPLTGNNAANTPVTGDVNFDNGISLKWKKSSGSTAYSVLCLDGSNQLMLGLATAWQSCDTKIYGNNIYLNYGVSGTTGITIASGGNVTIANNLTVSGTSTLTGAVTASSTITATGAITGGSIVKKNGTSTQFLKADGSVDESTYLKASDTDLFSTLTSTSAINLTVKVGNTTKTITNLYANYLNGNPWHWYMKRGSVYTGNVSGARWMKAASFETITAFDISHYSEIVLAVNDFTSREQVGILSVCYGREPNATAPRTDYVYAKWIVKTKAIDTDRFVLAYDFSYTSSTATSRAYLYVKMTGVWQQFSFTKISETGWSGNANIWVLNTGGTTSAYSYTDIPETNQVVSADITYASNAGMLNGVAASGYVTIAGTQKITGVKTFDVDKLEVLGGEIEGNVNKSTIKFKTFANNTYYRHDNSGVVNTSSAIRNSILFDWYDTAWVIGNIRGGGTDSYGFGFGCRFSNNGNVLDRFHITTVGDAYVATSLYAGSEVTASSDERLKDVVNVTTLTVNDIADAPSIKYLWKDKRDEKVHIGSIAQYWENALPEAVSYDDKGIMSLNYGALALVSAITIARALVKHEDEITKLKRENEELKERISALERRAA